MPLLLISVLATERSSHLLRSRWRFFLPRLRDLGCRLSLGVDAEHAHHWLFEPGLIIDVEAVCLRAARDHPLVPCVLWRAVLVLGSLGKVRRHPDNRVAIVAKTAEVLRFDQLAFICCSYLGKEAWVVLGPSGRVAMGLLRRVINFVISVSVSVDGHLVLQLSHPFDWTFALLMLLLG